MPQQIQFLRSSTAGNIPTAAQIVVGHLAINFADTKLYTKNEANTVIDLSPNASTTTLGRIKLAGDLGGSANLPTVPELINKANKGANSDITSLTGLTTPLSISQGGTGSSTKNFVDLTTDQEIAGAKTYTSIVNFNGVGVNSPSLTVGSYITLGNNEATGNAPTFGSRSIGTRLITNNRFNGATSADYAIGWETNSQWYSIPEAISTQSHKFYAGTTLVLEVKGDGTSFVNTPNTSDRSNTIVNTEYVKALIEFGYGFARLKAAVGYQRFPVGVIISWGSSTVNLDSSGNGVVTFPLAQVTVYTVVIVNGGTTQTTATFSFTSNTTTTFTFAVRPNPGAVTIKVNWISVGSVS